MEWVIVSWIGAVCVGLLIAALTLSIMVSIVKSMFARPTREGRPNGSRIISSSLDRDR